MRILSCVEDEDDDDDELVNSEDGNGELHTNNVSMRSESPGGINLTFTPQQAHIFGEQSIFLSFINIDTPLHEDTFYYVVFKGSKLQHITSAKVLNPYTLQAVIPDHNVAEHVMLSVHQYSEESNDLNPDTNIMATDTFVYISDSSQFLTQQLALNVDNSPYLLNLQNVYSSLLDIPVQEKKSLDYKLTTSFKNLSLPPNWSLVSKTKREDEKSWTLFHFCAKYNFTQLAEYLLTKPGAKEALEMFDEWDRSPIDISTLTKHKKMSEILSRTPSTEELAEECEKEKENPKVKRHKLGTTTFTSNVSPDKDISMKDLAVLMEYDSLACNSKGVQKNGGIERIEEISPLAQSLKKLNEIKDEIQRLRSINSQEDFDRLDAVEESFGADMVLNNSIDNLLDNSIDSTCNGEHLVDENMNERDKLIIVVTENGEKETKECEKTVEEEKAEVYFENDSEISGDVDVNDINFSIYVQDDEKPPEQLMQLSNIHVSTVDVQVAETVEIVHEEPVQEYVQCVITSDTVVGETEVTDAADLDTGELIYKLESVVEETEEELSAAGTGQSQLLKQRDGRSASVSETGSLNELPPLPNKRVGLLRKSVTKKDRPLSDSFENLRMAEKQGIVDFLFKAASAKDDENAHDSGMHHGHSLDTLTKNIDDNDNEWSDMHVNESHGSQESVSSDSEYLRDRTDSGKSFNSQRTRSLLSLNDLLTLPRSSYSDLPRNNSYSEDKLSKKSSSLFHRLSFKKAKSLTSLDMSDEKKNASKIEERRKTVQGNLDEYDGERMQNSDHVRSASYDENMKKSKSSVTISKHKKGHEQSDEDTDEGTSHEIGEQHPAERKTSSDEKQKASASLFSILRTGSKGSKEKKQRNKESKKVATNKQEPVVPNKSDAKKNLQKRAGSFRQNFKQVADSSSEMLYRTSNVITNKRSSERKTSDKKSPSLSAKNAQILEVQEGGNGKGEVGGSDPALFPLTKNLSSSQTSLNSDSLIIDDDTDAAPYTLLTEVEFDPDLDKNEYDGVESWSELVDKKIQKKLNAKDIKRQDVIFELIQTEAQYVRILQIMKKIYHDGMIQHLNYTADILSAMFPVLEDLIDLNGNFLRDMKIEQKENSGNHIVKRIGNVILKHFDGENGKLFRERYGYFCSHHLEAVAFYKELSKSDKRFQHFNKNCIASERTRRLSVPECITYVTIRITKYPLLIEAIIKATKDVNPDYADLNKSLSVLKEILSGVDEDVEAHEQQKELDNLKKNLDKNVVEIKNEAAKKVYRFKAHRLFHKRSRLLYDKKLILKSKTKSYDTRMIILAEKIIFFQENGGKLHLLNVDNKMPVMSLKGVMVRENAADSKALFLMNKSEEKVELYEIIFEKHKEKDEFMPKLDKFITNCPDEEEENLTDNEEDARKEEEERLRRLKRLVDYLESINRDIQTHLEVKNKTVQELLELTDEESCVKAGSPCGEIRPVDIYNTKLQLEEFLSQVNAILHSCSSIPNTSPASSPSQGNHNSSSNTVTTKKADTFGGFDNRNKPNSTNNIARATSQKATLRPSSDADITPKQRRQSQFMQVLGRSKTMGSNEDISSLSSSSSLANFIPPSLSEMQVYQHLSVGLGSLVEVTNQQDLEMAKMRCDLQDARALQLKTEAELSDIREKLTLHQKDSERQLRIEKDNYARLTRELKRNKEKCLKLTEQNTKSNPEEMLV